MTTAPVTVIRRWPSQATELPASLPERPVDQATLEVFLEWAQATYWPVERPPLLYVDTDVQWWPHSIWGSAPGRHYDWPFRGLSWVDYTAAMTFWGIQVAAYAGAATHMEMPPGGERPSSDGDLVPLHLEDGSVVSLESWEIMRGPGPYDRGTTRNTWNYDPGDAHLWTWVIAGRGQTGPMAEKNRDQMLRLALMSAQRIWDLIALYLPLAIQASEEEETPSPDPRGEKPRRKNRWD